LFNFHGCPNLQYKTPPKKKGSGRVEKFPGFTIPKMLFSKRGGFPFPPKKNKDFSFFWEKKKKKKNPPPVFPPENKKKPPKNFPPGGGFLFFLKPPPPVLKRILYN
jgi:hypothetical protein